MKVRLRANPQSVVLHTRDEEHTSCGVEITPGDDLNARRKKGDMQCLACEKSTRWGK